MNRPFAPNAEPVYVAQTAEPMSGDQRRLWFQARAEEAHTEKGATWFRFSVHPTIEHLALIEAWVVRPKDEGDIRWNLEVA